MVSEVESSFHAACGVGLFANFPASECSHSFLLQGLTLLQKLAYRGGYNPVTQESDGVGIRVFPLPTPFFNQKIAEGEFTANNGKKLKNLFLQNQQYVIGFYFLPQEEQELCQAKQLIIHTAKTNYLETIAWRKISPTPSFALPILSEQKKPTLVQCLFIPGPKLKKKRIDLETASLSTALAIKTKAFETNFSLNIISQSAESIVYKGLMKADELAKYYTDLNDHLFTASAVLLHTRFATNTEPQWYNVQPCPFFAAHNGEFNSYQSNYYQLNQQLASLGFSKLKPKIPLSDSTLFDLDLALQMFTKNITVTEAAVRLMMTANNLSFNHSIHSMIACFNAERTPYNGPALAIMGKNNHYVAALDAMGLRPARLTIIKNNQNQIKQVFLGSDDCLDIKIAKNQLIEKTHLMPGEIVQFTPEGLLKRGASVLNKLFDHYENKVKDYFFQKTQHVIPLQNFPYQTFSIESLEDNKTLNQKLYAAGWDRESEYDYVYFMAENGKEKIGAMGDDTDPLHRNLIIHPSFFLHPNFAQVTAPPLDSIKERERFSLQVLLRTQNLNGQYKCIQLTSPILAAKELAMIEQQQAIVSKTLDITIPYNDLNFQIFNQAFNDRLLCLLEETKQAIFQDKVNIIILSDKALSDKQCPLPDLIALSAIVKHLEKLNLSHQCSIVVDSQQIYSPHQAIVLLAFGAKAVFPRGAYKKIQQHYGSDCESYYKNYNESIKIALLKNMGKMGITDVNNYINSRLMTALGLDLTPKETQTEEINLGNLLAGVYSPVKGINLEIIKKNSVLRHQQAFDPLNNITSLPAYGHFIPIKSGIKHGFGSEVVNAVTQWIKSERLRDNEYHLHNAIKKKWNKNFKDDISIFTPQQGFLNPALKNTAGFYPAEILEDFQHSPFFHIMANRINDYRIKHPTALRDHFSLKKNMQEISKKISKLSQALQSQTSIRQVLYSGSMSQGALTVEAHETLTQGMNAIGANSASGEGGEAFEHLSDPLRSASCKQIASGRFGISAAQIIYAKEIEIKIAQGAKPGEGGELSGEKVSIRFAAQRGGLPGIGFTSPPPHHDIYSIEDLEQLIHDIKSLNPEVKVAVKLVAAKDLGTIAVGVVKAGADIINIASNSGGTGAAPQSSIKHTGLPSELGLVDVNHTLLKAQIRGSVQLRISGGFKTADEVIIASILGADLFEFGTTAMLTLGCKMQRTCNKSCRPGVAADGDLFQGNTLDVERYFVNLAATIQLRLKELGFNSLTEIQGHTELLQLHYPDLDACYDFKKILTPFSINKESKKEDRKNCPISSQLINELKRNIQQQENFSSFNPLPISLTSTNRSFPAGLIGEMVRLNKPITATLSTSGIAGQSYGFALASGISLKHTGAVQDGCGKSMTGGTLVISNPDSYKDKAAENTIAGNHVCYGASGGKIFINGKVGQRAGILLKGAQIVIEGVGDLAFEYMTSGTALILGKCGKGLCTAAQGGIVFVHDKHNHCQPSKAVRIADKTEQAAYLPNIKTMLLEHFEHTHSVQAADLLKNFKPGEFKVLIPMALDQITTFEQIKADFATFQLRRSPISIGMKTWLEQKTLALAKQLALRQETRQLIQLKKILKDLPFTTSIHVTNKIQHLIRKLFVKKTFRVSMASEANLRVNGIGITEKEISSIKSLRPIETRLASIDGKTDYIFADFLSQIGNYTYQLSHYAHHCSGCRAQSCSSSDTIETGCPGGKPINAINATLKQIGSIANNQLSLKQWKLLRQAFELQIKATPFIAYTGAACPAPCEDGCTESIPKRGSPVQIKNIEYLLFLFGRHLGWFDTKNWSQEEIIRIFGNVENKKNYDDMMAQFDPPFKIPEKKFPYKVIIIGSGPAGMQFAFESLRDGLEVVMYEKSDRPGGMLNDGIPAHKFEKIYIDEDFLHLKNMGLKLFLNSAIVYDENLKNFFIKEDQLKNPIYDKYNENQFLVICTGTGEPKKLALNIDGIPSSKIFQAVDFLKAANDLANYLKHSPHLNNDEKHHLIKNKMQHMDPRLKNIAVIGGGDTAQDILRWAARYFNYASNTKGKLIQLVRGLPLREERNIADCYPAHSNALTPENHLMAEEIHFIQGTNLFLTEPEKIEMNESGKLILTIKHSKLKHAELIFTDPMLTKIYHQLPRENKPIDKEESYHTSIIVDSIICAMGFEKLSPLAKASLNLERCYNVAFDAKTIIEAQATASNDYQKKIRPKLAQLFYSQNKRPQTSKNLPYFFPTTPHCRPKIKTQVPDINELNIADPIAITSLNW